MIVQKSTTELDDDRILFWKVSDQNDLLPTLKILISPNFWLNLLAYNLVQKKYPFCEEKRLT